MAVIGAVGGAGATTLAAHLATALLLQKRDILCLDWCAENRLRLHFGMRLDDRAGWARALLDRREWTDSAYHGAGGVDFVPFGALRDHAELDRLAALLGDEPQWLRMQLDSLQMPEESIVVCDCPHYPAALQRQVVDCADLVLIACLPDAVSYAAATHMAASAASRRGAGMIVLNGFDAARRLDRDISVLLRTWHGEHCAPVTIHRDEAVREAVACKQTVFEFAPSGQAARDFTALATWVLARLGHAVSS